MKIAIVGSGISGLSAAYYLSKKHKVDLFEKGDHFGGHAYTIDLNIDNNDKQFIPVDIGFIVFNHYDQREESLTALSKWINEGKIKYKEDFVEGLENAPNAFIGLLNGKNFGKLVVKVNPDPTM